MIRNIIYTVRQRCALGCFAEPPGIANQATAPDWHSYSLSFRHKMQGRNSLGRNKVRQRCEIFGEYIAANGATVRDAAEKFGISKSTVHKDITDKLRHVNQALYRNVKKVLEQNKSERHLRGGAATKLRYAREREQREHLLRHTNSKK